MVKFVYKIFPVFILRNNLVPKGFTAITLGLFVNLIPAVPNDMVDQIVHHELVHVRQQIRTLGLFFILYFISKKYRLKSECEAYAAELKLANTKLTYNDAVWKLQQYNTGYSIDQIKNCLGDYLWKTN